MNLRAWTRTQIAGLLFIVVGLMNLLTSDYLLGLIWALLGISMIAYVPGREGERSLRRFEPSPRNYAAVGAVILAIVLLVIEFAGLIG